MIVGHSSLLKTSLLFISDGYEQKSRVKRPRAPPPEPENDVEDFDERNNELNPNFVPPGFLSPSVIEYLELGKSIPGTFILNNFCSLCSLRLNYVKLIW